MGEKKRTTMMMMMMMMRRAPRAGRRLRQATLVLGLCLALYCLVFVSRTPRRQTAGTGPAGGAPPAELLSNRSLDEAQCRAAFPGLTREIDDAVAEGPFVVKQTGDLGPLQGRIKDGQVSAFVRLFCLVPFLKSGDRKTDRWVD